MKTLLEQLKKLKKKNAKLQRKRQKLASLRGSINQPYLNYKRNYLLGPIYKNIMGKKLLAILVLCVCMLSFTSCTQSCQRSIKSIKSDWNGGLRRTAILYDYNGDTIKMWEGKFDIRDSGSDNQIFFDVNEKRVWIQGGIFVSEEE